jgi:hypothetical protein
MFGLARVIAVSEFWMALNARFNLISGSSQVNAFASHDANSATAFARC